MAEEQKAPEFSILRVYNKDISLETPNLPQIFKEEFNEEIFKDLNPISYKKVGSVATVIFKDEKEKVEEALKKMNPVILDFLSLTLEEIFIYEMEVIGYEFNQVF